MQSFNLIFLLFNLFLGCKQFFFGFFNISYHVGVGLVGLFKHSFGEFAFVFLVFQLLIKLSDLLLQAFHFPLFSLQPVGQQQTLLNASFGSSRGTCDRGDKCIAYGVDAAVYVLIVGDVHDGLVELFLDELVVAQAFLADSEFGPDVSAALAVKGLEFVVLGLQDVYLGLQGFILYLKVLNKHHVILVQVSDSLSFIALASHTKLEPADLFVSGLLELPVLDHELLVGAGLVAEVLLELQDAPFKGLLELPHVVNALLVDLSQVLLSQVQFSCMSVLQVRHLLGVLLLELALDVVVGREHALHVLGGSALGLGELGFIAVQLFLQALEALLQPDVLAGEVGFVLVEQVDLSAEGVRPALDFQLLVLQPAELVLQVLVLALEAPQVDLHLAVVLIGLAVVAAFLQQDFVLGGSAVQVLFQLAHTAV